MIEGSTYKVIGNDDNSSFYLTAYSGGKWLFTVLVKKSLDGMAPEGLDSLFNEMLGSDPYNRDMAKKKLMYSANSHACICETLRTVYDEVYGLPEGETKERITELLVDAYVMGKKMADRLTYYRVTYKDGTGSEAINLERICGYVDRIKKRRARM
jgi:hypothetical protein